MGDILYILLYSNSSYIVFWFDVEGCLLGLVGSDVVFDYIFLVFFLSSYSKFDLRFGGGNSGGGNNR